MPQVVSQGRILKKMVVNYLILIKPILFSKLFNTPNKPLTIPISSLLWMLGLQISYSLILFPNSFNDQLGEISSSLRQNWKFVLNHNKYWHYSFDLYNKLYINRQMFFNYISWYMLRYIELNTFIEYVIVFIKLYLDFFVLFFLCKKV